jgi:serine/threonine protein kinase
VTQPDDDELIGRVVLGRYRIVHRLASGGMGVVYLARSEGAQGFAKPMVIKRILPHLVGDQALVAMFAREARIMSNLSHPNIVGILDFAEDKGAYLMVLEYVNGFHLGRWHRYVRRTGGQFPVEPAIHIVISVLDALHYAHTLAAPDGQPLHIVHRDVSPGNVLVDVEGRCKLTDFGIARMRTDKTSAEDKRALKGTFSYMAPELLKMGEPGPQSDLYSCAVILHEILAGKNEFYAKDVAATAWRVLQHVPSPIEIFRSDVPPGLSDVLKRGLAKAPEDRYADALEFAHELRRVRGIAADDAARMLAEAAAKDFNNPEMAALLQVTDLATLDRKWREPGKRFSFRPSLKPRRSDPTNSSTKAVSEFPQMLRRLAHRKGVMLGAAAGALAAGVAAVVAMRLQTHEHAASAVIMVEGSVSAVGVAAQTAPPQSDPSAVVAAKTADTMTSAPSSSAPPPTNPKASPAKSRSELLTRAFARQESQIARCFSQHASEISGNPEISVRFDVKTDGRVLSAQVQPPALASTALGGCIASVARATEFGPQPEPTQFRIPITAKRGL